MDDKESFINNHEKAPLIELDDFLCPSTSNSFYVRTYDNKKIRVALWNHESEKGTILLQSGRTEFIEKYYEVVQGFIDRGFCVVAMDWRGQGLSERTSNNPRLGHIDSFDEYDKDFETIVEKTYKHLCPKPWIGFGHSMGGCLLATNFTKYENNYQALILCAPMLTMKVNIWVKRVTKLIVLLLPWLKKLPLSPPNWDKKQGWIEEDFKNNNLTGDKYRFDRAFRLISKHPDLGVKGLSFGWVNEAFKRIKEFNYPEWGKNITKPVLLLSAGKDILVDSVKNELICKSIPNSFISCINGKHELLMEQDDIQKEAWKAIDEFLERIYE